jgi:hypothetical protein
MTTGTELKLKLAPLLCLSTMTLDRYLASLAKAGLIRRSGLGGGKAAHHLLPAEYAYLLLSLAASSPNGAADAARKLGGLFPEPSGAGISSLRTHLTATVESMALDIRLGIKRAENQRDQSWRLVLCVNPLSAEATWPAYGPDAVRRYFDYADAQTIVPPPDDAVPLLRRQAVLTAPLLTAIARLCADYNEDADPLAGGSASVAAPTAERQDRSSSNATPRVCVSSTARPRGDHDPRRRHSTATPAAAGVA